MIVYFVRHAEAVPLGGTVRHDADRPLSHGGERAAGKLGALLGILEPSIPIVLTSPLLRARQTAEAIAGAQTPVPPLRVTENLAPGFRRKALLQELMGLDVHGPVVAVGHQPDLGDLLSVLISGSVGASLVMKPSAAARVTITASSDRPDGRLDWLLHPDVLAVLAAPGGRSTEGSSTKGV